MKGGLDRSGLLLNRLLEDKIADSREELNNVIATGFGSILDLEVWPDGYLYILSEVTITDLLKLMPTKSQ